jgi:hypothetical protein
MIKLEELIDTLLEIQTRFTKNQPATFKDTGISFGYRISPIDGGIDIHLSREVATDLKELYREKD